MRTQGPPGPAAGRAAGRGDLHAPPRERMVAELEERRGIRDPRVLAAMRQVPRHLFVREHLRSQAYGDHALPIGGGQTISQPYTVARMSELLEVAADHTVLEVGTGSGYQTAVLALLARRVYSLERVADLAHQAIQRMRDLGVRNVKIQAFDGTVGWSDVQPFDRILVAAAAPEAPPPLLEQLAVGGRMVIPEGTQREQRLVVYQKSARGLRRQVGEAAAFVPLLGRYGWQGGG